MPLRSELDFGFDARRWWWVTYRLLWHSVSDLGPDDCQLIQNENPKSKIQRARQGAGIRGPPWQAQPGAQGAAEATGGDFSPTPISP